ncbi:hypothetical protein RRG08_013145 [Elysia crispata]|uniref:Uncharacterized protein n=1 Tax=Elysia crispata TaxID=231223 RepID=A0AAE1A1E9_9GAST|nr:hypothetical protein RRG08_013145 [Elysia crispata]
MINLGPAEAIITGQIITKNALCTLRLERLETYTVTRGRLGIGFPYHPGPYIFLKSNLSPLQDVGDGPDDPPVDSRTWNLRISSGQPVSSWDGHLLAGSRRTPAVEDMRRRIAKRIV